MKILASILLVVTFLLGVMAVVLLLMLVNFDYEKYERGYGLGYEDDDEMTDEKRKFNEQMCASCDEDDTRCRNCIYSRR